MEKPANQNSGYRYLMAVDVLLRFVRVQPIKSIFDSSEGSFLQDAYQGAW